MKPYLISTGQAKVRGKLYLAGQSVFLDKEEYQYIWQQGILAPVNSDVRRPLHPGESILTMPVRSLQSVDKEWLKHAFMATFKYGKIEHLENLDSKDMAEMILVRRSM